MPTRREFLTRGAALSMVGMSPLAAVVKGLSETTAHPQPKCYTWAGQ